MLSFTEQAQAGTAGLLLARAGSKTSFQRYAAGVPDKVAGSQPEVASGSPVLAAMVKDMETRSRGGDASSGSRPVRTKREVFHVEVPAFEPDGLSEEYRPTFGGVERKLEGTPIMNDDDTFWVIEFTTGGD